MSSTRFEHYLPEAQLFAARLVLFQEVVSLQLAISPTDLKCFRLVQRLGPLTAADLRAETGLTAAALSIVMDRLVDKSYLAREQDASDRRRWILRAQPSAIASVDKVYRSHAHAVKALLDSYNDREFERILDFLKVFADTLKTSALELMETYRDGTATSR